MGVNLKKSYSNLNEKLTQQFDGAGVRRSFTVPYVEGQQMADHIKGVGVAAKDAGGIIGNLITTSHHSNGKGYGSGDGHTVGHPYDKLRTTIIPKDDENAKATIAAAQRHLDNIEELLGEKNPVVMTAQNQLKLVKKNDGAGMTLEDFGGMMIQLMVGPNQAVAQAHSGNKQGGHAAHLRGPEAPAATGPTAVQEGETQTGAPAPEAQPEAPEAQAAPAAAPQAPAEPAQAA